MRGLAAVESLLLAWLMAFAPAVAAGSAATIASPEIGSAARGPNIELRTVEPEARIELPAAGRLAFAGVGRVWLGTANGVAFVDPLTNEATEVVNVGHDVGLAVGFGSLWLTDFDRNLVERRDPVSGAVVAEIEVGTNPGDAVVTDDAVWIANHRAGTVSRIDPATNREIATITVGPAGRSGPSHMAVEGGRVWVGVPNAGRWVAIDGRSNLVVAQVRAPGRVVACGPITVDDGRLWTTSCWANPVAAVIDLRTEQARSFELGGVGGQPIVTESGVWIPVSDYGENPRLLRIDPVTLTIVDGVVLGNASFGAATGFGSVWLPEEGTGFETTMERYSIADLQP